MITIGCHLSVTNGYEAMGKTMLGFGGNTFAYFTRNPRGGRSRDIVPEDAAALDSYYNFHPGAHTGQGTERGVELIADALNSVLFPEMQTVVLLETMAGKGTEIGRSFEELRAIIDRVTLSEKLGVCFDTCHVWDAGYDIVGDLDGVLTRFDAIIGLDRLYAVHFNDSKNPCVSHNDRHEKLGQGFLRTDAMKRIALHPALQNKPFILETPNDDQGYIDEIRTVLSWME